MSTYSYDLCKPVAIVKYSVRKVDKGAGYGFAVLKDGEIIETFLNISDCAAFINLYSMGRIDEKYNDVLPKT